MASKKGRLILSVALMLIALLASSLTAHSQEMEEGKVLFEGWCGPCHGVAGAGNLAVPTIAGAAGHLAELGIADAGPEPLFELLRNGIPGNMPAFPPELMSDEEVLALGGYLFSLPPTTGERLYVANCALCHGSRGQGYIGPPLYTTVDFLAATGLTRDQAVPELKGLLKGGIPGRMPAVPQFTDEEVGRLLDFLLALTPPAPDPQWEAAFQAQQGRAPSALDRIGRDWSLEFAARFGRAPTEQDWAARAEVMQAAAAVAPPGPMGGPPPGGAPSR